MKPLMHPYAPSYRELDLAKAMLLAQAGTIENPHLRYLASIPLNDPRFWESPAAKGKHHAYPGGLAIHTWQVLAAALKLLEMFPDARRDLVTVAGIWHDYYKIHDYAQVPVSPLLSVYANDPRPTYEYTEHGQLIGHLAGSFARLMTEAAPMEAIDRSDLLLIGHIMLSHHGRKEWGSPIEPACTEAWALHAGDMLSAQFSSDAHIPAPQRKLP